MWIQNCDMSYLADALTKSNSYEVYGEHSVSKMFLNPSIKSRLVFNAFPTLHYSAVSINSIKNVFLI